MKNFVFVAVLAAILLIGCQSQCDVVSTPEGDRCAIGSKYEIDRHSRPPRAVCTCTINLVPKSSL